MIPTSAWVLFVVFVLAMLALDLGAFQRKSRELSAKEGLAWTSVWVTLALLFTIVVYYLYKHDDVAFSSTLSPGTAAAQYVTAWLVEWSLSLDNVFVFVLIFQFFQIPRKLQHRVLFWGIMGALILRGIMIGLGAALIQRYAFVNYIFGALLLYAAVKMMLFREEDFDPQSNWLLRIARKLYPVSPHLDGERFVTTLADGRRAITPLFVVLLVVESSDVLFAVDSIPACFGVTREPFLVFTSNIFAIMGLRSLYFVLSAMMAKFHYLKYSLITILLFIAVKMLGEHWVHVPTWVSLIIVASLMFVGLVASILWPSVEREVEIRESSDA